MHSRRPIAALMILIPFAGTVAAGGRDGFKPTSEEAAFLDDLELRSFRYFWEQSGKTGIVRDRALADGSSANAPNVNVGSAAATGFGLTAICIGVDRGWVGRGPGRERVLRTLRFLRDKAPRVHGWFYHWMHPDTGERVWASEISSIDSALLLAGVLVSGQFFADDLEIPQLARSIYEQVDFPWMLDGHKYLLRHGWTPESGFLAYRWDEYSELMILYLLAIGSPTHPIPGEAWYSWKRPEIEFEGIRFISGGPLFTHQYSQAWFDFRKLHEKSAHPVNWFANSVAATRAQRQFCYKLALKYPSYSGGLWGVTASDSAMGYTVWGDPPRTARIDGTLVPSAAGGSMMFAPEATVPVLLSMYQRFSGKLYRRYGFADAFNPSVGWVSQQVIGIDVGIILLSAENLRSGFVWRQFMRSPAAQLALREIEVKQEPAEGFGERIRRFFGWPFRLRGTTSGSHRSTRDHGDSLVFTGTSNLAVRTSVPGCRIPIIRYKCPRSFGPLSGLFDSCQGVARPSRSGTPLYACNSQPFSSAGIDQL